MKEFKIVNVRTGNVMMHTSDPECMPDDETIKHMISAGYKAFMDGKVYRPGKKQPEPEKKAKSKIKSDPSGQIMLF